MPQIKPEWAISGEAQDIVSKLCQLYPERFGHIMSDSIGCIGMMNKDKGENKKDSKIKGIKMPESLFCSKIYIIEFFQNSWEEYTPAQRAAMLIKNLDRIPDTEDGPDGSVLPEDLKDNRTLVKGWGVDYMDNPQLPDLSESKSLMPG